MTGTERTVRRTAFSIIHPGWLLGGIALGVGLQFLGWLTGVGLLAGLPSYLIMGVLIGWASPGDTVVEPGIAAFVIAVLGFVLDHLLLSILGIGVALAIGYGALGLVFGMVGGWIGERIQSEL